LGRKGSWKGFSVTLGDFWQVSLIGIFKQLERLFCDIGRFLAGQSDWNF